MLCKNCGKEMPIAGKFCPFCGAPTELVSATDETAVFTPIPEAEQTPGIDQAAFDAVRADASRPAGPLDETGDVPAMPPIDVPPVRRAAPASRPAPRTTYFEPTDPTDTPYKKPGAGKKAAIIALVVLLIAGLIGGGVWFALSRKPDENLTLAEKYMQKGKFEDALAAYQAALVDAKDPVVIEQQIELLTDYQTAQDYVDSGEYAQALALLQSLSGRISDKTSPLAEAVQALAEQAEAAQSDASFQEELASAEAYLAEDKFDQCAAVLDVLAGDSSLSDAQKKKIDKLREQLTEKQAAAERKEQNEQQAAEQKQSFADRIAALEKSDKALTEQDTTEKTLELTASSFEAWDTLLNDMYDYLATTLNAESYANEEKKYKEWITERDTGAEIAAQDAAASASEDPTTPEAKTAAELARTSFKQSYTKARCSKLFEEKI